MRGCFWKKSIKTGSSAFESVRDLSSSGESDFIKVNGFVKKRKKLIFVVVEFILAIFKNFCQSELLICYHVGISPLGGLVDSF